MTDREHAPHSGCHSARATSMAILATVGFAASHMLATAAPAAAADYWVAAAGSDGNPGTSQPQAWATLTHATAVVTAGDSVHVGAGSYQGFYFATSETAGNPITSVAGPRVVSIVADNPLTPTA